MQPGSFELNYPLGDTGSKTIFFTESGIKVKIIHRRNFTEILPLLVSPEDEFQIEKNRVKIIGKNGKVQIQFSKNNQIKASEFDAGLQQKNCRVVEISASNQLEYEFIFE